MLVQEPLFRPERNLQCVKFNMSNQQLKFVDLYAGLGGFNIALTKLGHMCVFASEIDPHLQNIYFKNHGILPQGNIRDSWEAIPPHDILCAGFPCQPFSKAGTQLGFDCPVSGDLFQYILNVIDKHRPSYLLFENVPNILNHADGETWNRIEVDLTERDYTVDKALLSPHEFGIPQIRNRAIIVASLTALSDFSWPEKTAYDKTTDLSAVLDETPNDSNLLPDEYLKYLDVWNEFLDRIGQKNKLPSFPIWSMEFGATYPINKRTPNSYSQSYLARFKGSFGVDLKGRTKEQQLALIPVYARSSREEFPRWKIRFIQQNREFFEEHQRKLQSWLPKVQEFAPSFQKLEWNWQQGDRSIWNKVIQFRASGIRVKNPSSAPSLVALTTSQVPVIAWKKRYMSMRECARIQCLDELEFLPERKTHAYKALGNAVNVKVVSLVAEKLLNNHSDRLQQ